ncbi:MAG: 16S rRNA (guanine(966)-N(2))-methyltransferase RsmD [Elusimicrobia bacterium]|nr:16S rRNA (guanine(966)-N(2))-methyltransferase RsmD [Elusimicrobiota bacterium]
MACRRSSVRSRSAPLFRPHPPSTQETSSLLKILAGTARGRVLRSGPKSPHLRPILARVKKSVFDILTPRMAGSRFLDIYAGTGAVGLEALSRGASRAVFVERDRRSSDLIRENLKLLGMEDKGAVFGLDAANDLSLLPRPFDLIFMGPPYKDDEKKPLALVAPTLEQIRKNTLLAAGGLIIAQHHRKEEVASTENWDLKRQERYGDTVVTFFQARS